MAKAWAVERLERRIPMEVVVQINGHNETPGIETTFTENVSSHGARVKTVRRWTANERLVISSLPGDFRAMARVAYCEPLHASGFVIGLEFLAPSGRWVVPTEGSAYERPAKRPRRNAR